MLLIGAYWCWLGFSSFVFIFYLLLLSFNPTTDFFGIFLALGLLPSFGCDIFFFKFLSLFDFNNFLDCDLLSEGLRGDLFLILLSLLVFGSGFLLFLILSLLLDPWGLILLLRLRLLSTFCGFPLALDFWFLIINKINKFIMYNAAHNSLKKWNYTLLSYHN